MDQHALQLQRDVGRLEGKMDAMAAQHAAMAAQNADMGTKLDHVVAYIDQQKGEKRATKFIAAAVSSVVGGLAALAVSWLHK